MTMNNYRKTIKQFLLDAEPNGRIICELSNWSGKAFRIPRDRVKACSDLPELETSAVYVLFGSVDSLADRPEAYIGETDNAFTRLKDHVNKKDFWQEAVVFISKDDNLNRAHVRHLEAVLVKGAIEANRYAVLNDKTPVADRLSQADAAEMEEFADYIGLLLNTLGHKLLQPVSEQTTSQQLFNISAARGAKATGVKASDGFVVKAGSFFANSEAPTTPKGTKHLRAQLIENNIVEANTFMLTEDYRFSSPSSAAAAVMGRSANGLIEWKANDGESLKDIELRELEGTDSL